jgi:quercetin dioxygenase-like cupin family protein
VGVLHTFSLAEYAHTLREAPRFAATDRSGITLSRTAGLRVELQALRAGAELPVHRAPGPITIHMLEGEVRFLVGEEVFRIRAGELLALPSHRSHAVEAMRDSTFLITMAPTEQKEIELP